MSEENTIILVVDMLKGFLEKGNLFCGDEARKIIPHVVDLLKSARRGKIFFICDNHDKNDREFKMFPPHCIKGTEESKVIDELSSFKGEIIPKTRYSGFFNTSLEKRLLETKPDKVIVVGVCTDICVLYTVADLRSRDYKVEVPKKCVASFDREAHKFALKHIEKILGATIT